MTEKRPELPPYWSVRELHPDEDGFPGWIADPIGGGCVEEVFSTREEAVEWIWGRDLPRDKWVTYADSQTARAVLAIAERDAALAEIKRLASIR